MARQMTLTINGGSPDNITFTHRHLVDQWDYDQNVGISPEMFDANSTDVVFWKCPVCKGTWRKGIAFRAHKDNGCPYCNNRKVLKGFNDLATKHPEVAEMWLPENNGGVGADEVLYCECGKKHTWYCKECDETFVETVRRVITRGCPKCRDKKRIGKELAKRSKGGKPRLMKNMTLREGYPHVADYWDEEKNGVSADEFKPWKKLDCEYWWHCPECNQSYLMRLGSKAYGSGCPVCQGKIVVRGYNDIETLRPDIVELWSDKNGDKKPWMYTTGSGQKAWFVCPECGEARYAVIAAVCKVSTLCKNCAGKLRSRMHIEKYGSLADRYPILEKQWHRTLNGGVTPDMVSPCSDFDAYWYCEKHDYTWHAKVVSRTQARAIGNCPKCVADDNRRPEPGKSLKDLFPDLAKEWDDDGNGSLRPEDFAPNSHMYVSWICPKCKEPYVKRISHRTVYGRGCECTFNKATSFPEKAVFYYVSMAYPDAMPNHTPNKNFGQMELDIYIPSLGVGVEYDGEYWHQESEKDERKDMICFINGITLIRIREPRCPKYELTVFYKEVVRADQSDDALDACIRRVLRMIDAPDTIDVDTVRDGNDIKALIAGDD